ncbi:MAG: nucleotidyltransferase domain-containing protein [Candidatus Helarchaeota archaeon]
MESLSPINQIGKELRHKLEEKFKKNLVSLAFYGSRVRGDNFPDSDLDLLIILNEFDEDEMILPISRICGELSLKYKITISPYIISSDDFQYGCEHLFPFNLGIYLGCFPFYGREFIENCHLFISKAIQDGKLKVYPDSGIFIQR